MSQKMPEYKVRIVKLEAWLEELLCEKMKAVFEIIKRGTYGPLKKTKWICMYNENWDPF